MRLYPRQPPFRNPLRLESLPLIQRIWQHRNDLVEGFTQRYKIHTLVWYEQHENMESAILREKEVKKWQRHAKIMLIEKGNPEWRDLWEDLVRG